MKHPFILITFFLFMALQSKAQWSLTPEIGISTSKRIPSSSIQTPRMVSWKIGIGTNYRFHNRWGISSGIYWSQPKWNETIPFGSSGGNISIAHQTYKANCFRLPIMASYYVPIKSVTLGLSLGPYIGYGANCKVLADIWDIPSSFVSGGGYGKTSATTSLDSYFDWGLSSRISLETEKLLLRFEYEMPFASVVQPHRVEPAFSIISLSFGYRFCFPK